MNRKLIGGSILAATVGLVGIAMFTTNKSQPSVKANPTAIIAPATPAVSPAAVTGSTNSSSAQLGNVLSVGPGPGPLVQAKAPEMRHFRCTKAGKTVIEFNQARDAEFMGQRNNRAYWKVDTGSRTATFNVDVRGVDCAFRN